MILDTSLDNSTQPVIAPEGHTTVCKLMGRRMLPDDAFILQRRPLTQPRNQIPKRQQLRRPGFRSQVSHDGTGPKGSATAATETSANGYGRADQPAAGPRCNCARILLELFLLLIADCNTPCANASKMCRTKRPKGRNRRKMAIPCKRQSPDGLPAFPNCPMTARRRSGHAAT